MIKFLCLCAAFFLAGVYPGGLAAVFLLSTSGASAFPDTEESLSAEIELPRRSAVTIRMECPATLTNCAEVVLGRDSDLDGELGWSEALLKFGWDAGSWFVSSPATGETSFEEPSVGGPSVGFRLTFHVDSAGTPHSATARAGHAAVLPSAARMAVEAGDASLWNCLRVVTRGGGAAAVRLSTRRDGSLVFVK